MGSGQQAQGGLRLSHTEGLPAEAYRPATRSCRCALGHCSTPLRSNWCPNSRAIAQEVRLMTDDDLIRLGFVRLDNGTFLPPPVAGMRLVPVGKYIGVQLVIGNGGAG